VKLPPQALLAVAALAAALFGACGSEGVQVNDRGAQLFAERCAGCHTLKAAGTHGSVGERISGPNLNNRKETPQTVLFAIRNGGFSGAIMPQNIVVGKDAADVAAFVAKYAGTQAKSPPAPVPAGATGNQGTTGAANASSSGKGKSSAKTGKSSGKRRKGSAK
jgi:mono/diheme cytochrome c family protein